MCVILVIPPQVRPALEIVQACATANPHGAGIAWRTKDGQHVRWRKTNSMQEVWNLVGQLKGEIVLHFRIASVGPVCPKLRHPFPVAKRSWLADEGRAKAVLFQNGTWEDWEQAVELAAHSGYAVPEGPMSDTRAAAWLCALFGRKLLVECEPSRWVYFSHRQTVLYGHWIERSGIWFSNANWERYLPFTNHNSPFTAGGLASRPPAELWDTALARRYWQRVESACPKPVRKVNLPTAP